MDGRIQDIVSAFARWARLRDDVVAVALIGSHARGTPHEGSDVDVLVLSRTPEAYEDDAAWIAGAPCRERAYVRRWGRLTEHRLLVDEGPEVELGIASPDWATARPLDAGTRRVVTDGLVALHDPEGILARLVSDV